MTVKCNEKQCTQCRELKDLTQFYRSKVGLYGHVSKCKTCVQAYEYKRNHSVEHRAHHRAWMGEYRRTLRGFLDQKYTAMSKRVRGKDKNCLDTVAGLPIAPRKEFLAWAYQQECLVPMFRRYRESNWEFSLCPTIDRIDPSKGYVIGNMQFLTQSDNARKGRS